MAETQDTEPNGVAAVSPQPSEAASKMNGHSGQDANLSSLTEPSKIEAKATLSGSNGDAGPEEPSAKRVKLDHPPPPAAIEHNGQPEERSDRQKGVAPIKKEFLVDVSKSVQPSHVDDDQAEAAGKSDPPPTGGRGGKKTQGGQNHAREFGSSRDAIQLCKSRSHAHEFAPQTCKFGANCKFEHDIRKYLKDGKREDLQTFVGSCPVWQVKGKCGAGWTCRFASSHSKEIEREDGRLELVQLSKEESGVDGAEEEAGMGVANVVSAGDKIALSRRRVSVPKSEKYLKWLSDLPNEEAKEDALKAVEAETGATLDRRADYREPPLRPSEKRRIYYGPETPILAPLTTQGNLPFRRLCVSLGAQVTWSEMAMGLPLLQGHKQEWALMKAHESELLPPNHSPTTVIKDYNHSTDIRFGAQIAANKPWLAVKTTEVLTDLCPHLRAIDLNCGCPIDLVYRQGAGSALLDTHTRLERILRGMNTVSGSVPITVKIRMGTKDKQPNAEKLCRRLILGSDEPQESSEGPSGVAAITLHGRSRQQRYTRSADWEYIASCASLVKQLKADRDAVTDTIRAPDARDLAASSVDGLPYFIGNGDVLSHADYTSHIQSTTVDSCMIARGALIKPWVFEEIAQNQYLDKTSAERLRYIEQFVRNGLEYWGSDEIGVGTTRRFLLEWLSFSCRYVPLGLLEYLPPRLGDRPPAFRGRDDLETLLSSGNYKDWIKISEMFLGPAHKDFKFQPKHKSNSYEIEAEG